MDRLNVSSEKVLFEAVMNWYRNSPTARVTYLADVLSYVKLPLLPSSYLLGEVLDNIGDIVEGKDANGKCFKTTSTWSEAKDACAGFGARLCTTRELKTGAGFATGCGGDSRPVWSNDKCANGFRHVTASTEKVKCVPSKTKRRHPL